MTLWRLFDLIWMLFWCYVSAGMIVDNLGQCQLQIKPLVSDPGMHHGTCVTHVPWCISGSLTRGGGETVPGIPGACTPAILRIWQEPHTWWYPGPNFNIKLSCEYMYMTSHCGDKAVIRSSYLHDVISYTGKMASLYWISSLGAVSR